LPKTAQVPLPLWNHITIGPPQKIQGSGNDITLRLHDHLKTLTEEEQAFRQRRMPEPHRPFSVAVIGIDGSGKSTLSRRLAGCFKEDGCFIGDRIELFKDGKPCVAQPLMADEMRKWVGRRAKKAKNLAHYKIPKIAELILRDRLLSDVARWYRPAHIFMDGSPLLNMTAWATLYHEEFFNAEVCAKAMDILSGNACGAKNGPLLDQFPELGALHKLKLTHLHLPDAVIFIDIDPAVSIERIASRGEAVQAHENIEKLTKLRAAYGLVSNVLKETRPVICLDGNKTQEQLADEAAAFIKQVRSAPDETH
jgi:adenylate kinase family enzyme